MSASAPPARSPVAMSHVGLALRGETDQREPLHRGASIDLTPAAAGAATGCGDVESHGASLFARECSVPEPVREQPALAHGREGHADREPTVAGAEGDEERRGRSPGGGEHGTQPHPGSLAAGDHRGDLGDLLGQRGELLERVPTRRRYQALDAKQAHGAAVPGTGTLGMRLEKAGVLATISSRTKLSGFGARPGGGGGRGGGFGGNQPAGGRSDRGGGPAASKAEAQAGLGGFGGGANGTGGWGVIEVFETYNTIAPAVTLTCEDYGLLYRLAENNQHPQVRLDLDAELLGEVPAFNTIGMIKGVEKPDEYVMLSAHFDSWDGSSGATDNGTGTLMAMEAMRLLKLAYPRPKRTILVGHWASEEQGLNGSRAFTEDHPEVMKGLQALFNQDNGTGRVQSISAAGLTDIGRHLKAWYGKLPAFYSDSLSDNVVSWTFNDRPTGNPGGTDGAVFACYGTPSFGLGAVGWNYGTYTWHTNRDTYDKVVFSDLKHNATLAAAEGGIPATFRLLVLTGWAPSATQPQPARPGSATTRLAEALGTVERSAGEKTGR